MPGINERVNKSKEERRKGKRRERWSGRAGEDREQRGEKGENIERARVRGQNEDGSTETSLPRCIRFLRASDDSRLFTGARGHLAAIRVKEEALRV